MSLLEERLYTSSDKEEILDEMLTYISHNNIYEHQLHYPEKEFSGIPNPIPEWFLKGTIEKSFGKSLVRAGNTLKTQSIFIAKRMPHIRSYLSKTRVSHSFLYYKPSDIVMADLSAKAIRCNSIESAIEKTLEDGCESKYSPFNVFYKLWLIIDNPTVGFVKDMDKLHGITREEENIPKGPIRISLLPADSEHRRIDEIIRLIHKHY